MLSAHVSAALRDRGDEAFLAEEGDGPAGGGPGHLSGVDHLRLGRQPSLWPLLARWETPADTWLHAYDIGARSASWRTQVGPARATVRSMTRMSSSGSFVVVTLHRPLPALLTLSISIIPQGRHVARARYHAQMHRKGRSCGHHALLGMIAAAPSSSAILRRAQARGSWAAPSGRTALRSGGS